MNVIAVLGAASDRRPLPRWVLVLVLAIAGVGTANAAASEGQEAADFALRTLDGQNLRLSEYRGEVVLINFWATWCSDCRQQLIALESLYAKYRKAGFVLLSINVDDDGARAADTVRRLKLSYPVLMDARKEVAKLYQLDNLPLTVVVDREGTVRRLYSGYKVGAEQSYLEQVRDLLKE